MSLSILTLKTSSSYKKKSLKLSTVSKLLDGVFSGGQAYQLTTAMERWLLSTRRHKMDVFTILSLRETNVSLLLTGPTPAVSPPVHRCVLFICLHRGPMCLSVNIVIEDPPAP